MGMVAITPLRFQQQKLRLGARKVAVNLGQGSVNTRVVSDNKIQLKFRSKDFVGELFHYTNDLFLIYRPGHLGG
jgi:hypothetical protein